MNVGSSASTSSCLGTQGHNKSIFLARKTSASNFFGRRQSHVMDRFAAGSWRSGTKLEKLLLLPPILCGIGMHWDPALRCGAPCPASSGSLQITELWGCEVSCPVSMSCP